MRNLTGKALSSFASYTLGISPCHTVIKALEPSQKRSWMKVFSKHQCEQSSTNFLSFIQVEILSWITLAVNVQPAESVQKMRSVSIVCRNICIFMVQIMNGLRRCKFLLNHEIHWVALAKLFSFSLTNLVIRAKGYIVKHLKWENKK